MERTHELQGEHHEHHRSVLDGDALVEVGTDQFVVAPEAALGELLPAALEHVL